MNIKEKELFLKLCAFHDIDKDGLVELIEAGADTSDVLGELLANRMAGVAYYVLGEARLLERVENDFAEQLCNAARFNEKVNEDYFECIRTVSGILEKSGVSYALLKGAYLFSHYPKACRTSNDIDVLVMPEDVGAVSSALKENGFGQGYIRGGNFIAATRAQIIGSKMMRGETVPFIKEVNLPFTKYLEVDVNFSLDYKNGDTGVLNTMLERGRKVFKDGLCVRTLSEVDFLLHLCLHLYKEATTMPWIKMKRDMTLYKFCDIYALLREASDRKIKEVTCVARDSGMEREIAYCINAVSSLFPSLSDICKEVKKEISWDGIDEVISPSEKKIYKYSQADVVERFFSENRIKLLKEIKNEKT